MLSKDGYVVIAVFAPDDAKKCSVIYTRNYYAEKLQEFLGVILLWKRQ